MGCQEGGLARFSIMLFVFLLDTLVSLFLDPVLDISQIVLELFSSKIVAWVVCHFKFQFFLVLLLLSFVVSIMAPIISLSKDLDDRGRHIVLKTVAKYMVNDEKQKANPNHNTWVKYNEQQPVSLLCFLVILVLLVDNPWRLRWRG